MASKFTYADIFCGIGGYSYALNAVGGECVFACDKDEDARRTYEKNFGIKPYGDIRDQATIDAIPEHIDVVCCDIPIEPFMDKPTLEEYNNSGLNDLDGAVFFDFYDLFIKRQQRASETYRYDQSNLNSNILRSNVILMNYFDLIWTKSRFTEIDEPWKKLISHYWGDWSKREFFIKNLKCVNTPLTHHMVTLVFTHPCYWITKPKEGSSWDHDYIKETFKFNRFTNKIKGKKKTTLRKFLQNGVTKNSKSLDKSLEYAAWDVDDPESVPSILGDDVLIIKDKKVIRHLTPREYLNLQGFPQDFQFAEGISVEKQYKLAKNATNVTWMKWLAKELPQNFNG